MSDRPAVPRNVERMLWAEAIGHCMNPECQSDLIKDDTNVGIMAHIEPNADGGDVTFDNLVLLCSECHKLIDSNRTEATVGEMEEWKKNRNIEIREQFETAYTTFEKLGEAIVPILERNGQIFDSYGPENDYRNNAERFQLWLRFEGEIVSNNRRLELILTKNKALLHRENQAIVDLFVIHAREFVETRGDNPMSRFQLFPLELHSIFGLDRVLTRFPPNLSALQNLISHLIDTSRFISLELSGEPSLTYLDSGENVTLFLRDRPRLQQVFWSGGFFKSPTTDGRVENLVFFVQWLIGNSIKYEFIDMHDLTLLTLNNKYQVRLSYKYVLSLSDVQDMTLNAGDLVVNLHNWNGAPISKDAEKYASSIGVRLFSQNDFFIFAHRNIK